MPDFLPEFEHCVGLINGAMPGFLPDEDFGQKAVTDAMAYSLLDGGKRVRAVLLLAFYRLFSQDADGMDRALPFAAAVEMIHAYSLIHDDLPCMDDDDTRRGKPACHIAFGEATALLAGDALLTLAFETMSAESCALHFGAQKTLSCIRALANAAGSRGMIGGQVLDLASETCAVSGDRLRTTDEKKTGALICAAVRMGCILGGADDAGTHSALDYALNLGLAFQVVDDILDHTADPALLGKPVGSDAANSKSTYVSLYGIAGATEMAARMSGAAKTALAAIDADTRFLEDLADYLLDRRY